MPQRTEVFEAKLVVNQEGINQVHKSLVELAKSAQDAAKAMEGLSSAKGPAKVDVDFSQVKKNAEDVKKTFSDMADTINSNAAKINIDSEIDTQTQKIIGRINAVSQETRAPLTQMIDRFQDVRSGLTLAFQGEGIGARAAGIRQAFFGMNESSNVAAKGLDFLARTFTRTSNSTQAIVADAERIAKSFLNLNDTIDTQLKDFKNLSSTMGATKGDFQNIDLSVQKLRNEWQKTLNTIESTGKITPHQLAQVRNQTELVEKQFNSLRQRGIVPLGSEADKVLREIEAEFAANARAATNLSARMNSVKDSANGMSGAVGVLARLKGSITSLFGIFGRTKSDIQQTSSSIGGIGKSIAALSNPLSAFKTIFLGTFAGTFLSNTIFSFVNTVTNALSRLPAAIVGLASDAEEAASAFGFLFGDAADKANTSLDSLGAAIGRSTFMLKQQSTTFAGVFAGMVESGDVTADAAADWSVQLTALTQDLSSFYNTTDQQALDALRAGLIGESEPLRRYNVLLNETKVNTELMALGIEGGSAAATEEQKVLARLNIIMRETKAAHGDAARTSESWSNQTRTLQGQLIDMGTQIGQIVLPAIAPFLRILNDIISSVGPGFIAWLQQVSTSLLTFATDIANTFQNAINGVINFDSNLSVTLGAISALLQGDWQAAWDLFQLAVINAATLALDGIGGFISSAAEVIGGLIEQGFDWGYSFMAMIGQGIIDAGVEVLNAVIEIASQIASYLAPGSPPEKGPLSTIDKWGAGLVDTFESGLKSDADFLVDLLKPVSQAISKIDDGDLDKSGLFVSIQNQLDEITAKAIETGQVSSSAFDQIAGQLGPDNASLVKGLKLQVEQKAALAKIDKEIAEAEAKGFVPAALKIKRKELEAQFKQSEKQLSAEQELEELRAKAAGNEKDKLKSAVAAPKAAIGALKQQQATAEETYNKEIELLNQKKDSGIISEQQFLAERIRLNQNWFESEDNLNKEATAAQIRADQARLDSLKELEKEARKTGKVAKSELTGEITSLDIPDLLGNSIEQATPNLTKSLSNSVKTSIKGSIDDAKEILKQKTGELIDDFKKTIREKLTGFSLFGDSGLGLDTAQSALSKKLGELFAPILTAINNIKGVFTGISLLVGLASFTPLIKGASKSLPILTRVSSVVSRVASVIFPNLDKALTIAGKTISFLATKALPILRTGFMTLIRTTLPVATRFTIIGTVIAAVVYGIISNVELLANIFDDIFTRVLSSVIRFAKVIGNVLGLFSTDVNGDFSILSVILLGLIRVFNYLSAVIQSVLPNVQQFFAGLFRILHGVIQLGIALFDTFVGIFALLSGDAETATEAFNAAFSGIKDAIINAITGVFDILPSILTFSTNLSAEIIGGFLQMLGLETLGQAIKDKILGQSSAIQNAFATIKDIILAFFTGELNIQDLFEAAGLGQLGEFLSSQLMTTFGRLQVAFLQLKAVFQDQLLPIFTVVFGQISAAVSDAVNIISSRWQMLQPLWDFIILKLEELGISFDGQFSIIQFVVGAAVLFIIGIITSLSAIITGVVGGIVIAIEVLSRAFEFLSLGISQVITGIIGFLTGLKDFFVALFAGDFPGALEALKSAMEGFNNIFTGLWNIIVGIVGGSVGAILGFIVGLVSSIIEFFVGLSDTLVGNSIIPDMVADIIAAILGLGPTLLASLPGVMTTILNEFINFASQIITTIVNGLTTGASQIGTAISNLFGGLFGGGEEAAAPGAGPVDAVAMTTSLTTATTAFVTFQTTVQTIMTAIGTAWALMATTMTLDWATMLMNLTLGAQNFFLNLGLTLTNFGLTWNLFNINMVTRFTLTMITLTQMFTDFFTLVMGMLQQIAAMIEVVIERLITMGDQALITGEVTEQGMSRAANAIKGDLIPAIEEATKHFERMAAAAERAANAARGASDAFKGGGGGGPSAQGGAYRTWQGLWLLHDDEMVLPKSIADPFRTVLESLGNHGVGGQDFNIGIPDAGGARLQVPNLPDLDRIQAVKDVDVEFNTIINDRVDEALFREKVLRVVSEAIG